MSNLENRVAALKQSSDVRLARLSKSFTPSQNDMAVFQVMGVKLSEASVSKLSSGLSYSQRRWAEKSSTWETKK